MAILYVLATLFLHEMLAMEDEHDRFVARHWHREGLEAREMANSAHSGIASPNLWEGEIWDDEISPARQFVQETGRALSDAQKSQLQQKRRLRQLQRYFPIHSAETFRDIALRRRRRRAHKYHSNQIEQMEALISLLQEQHNRALRELSNLLQQVRANRINLVRNLHPDPESVLGVPQAPTLQELVQEDTNTLDVGLAEQQDAQDVPSLQHPVPLNVAETTLISWAKKPEREQTLVKQKIREYDDDDFKASAAFYDNNLREHWLASRPGIRVHALKLLLRQRSLNAMLMVRWFLKDLQFGTRSESQKMRMRLIAEKLSRENSDNDVKWRSMPNWVAGVLYSDTDTEDNFSSSEGAFSRSSTPLRTPRTSRQSSPGVLSSNSSNSSKESPTTAKQFRSRDGIENEVPVALPPLTPPPS